MVTVNRWTGREARALRLAVRRSVRGFAEELGVAPRTVAYWEARGQGTTPRPEMQAALDTLLALSTSDARTRFEQLMPSPSTSAAHAALSTSLAMPATLTQQGRDLTPAEVVEQ